MSRRGNAPQWPAPAPSARLRAGLDQAPTHVDLVVVGLGITGTGVALDAASRGLSVLAVDAFDVAFGTSRWSSKMVHGGLRYLAKGQLGVAHESAVERGILMETTAPHLTHPMPLLLPSLGSIGRAHVALASAGFIAGDLLRRAAHTSAATLPPPRRVSVTETISLAPSLDRIGLRGGVLSHDGQLEDDARLVTTMARTAAAHGAVIRTRARVLEASGTAVRLRDEITGLEHRVTCSAVVNAAGVWAGQVVPEIRLRPSRGTHLVFRASAFPGLKTSLTLPIPGSVNRFALVLPQQDGRVYVGLTDEPAEGPIPDVPTPSPEEVDFLLEVVGRALARPLTRDDVVGQFAGLRPLLDTGDGATADLSRRHAVLTSTTGVISVVGGKLTTYRQMAQDAVDAAVTRADLVAGPCRTHALPLLGAAPRAELDALSAPDRLVRRFGTEVGLVVDNAMSASGLSRAEVTSPIEAGLPITWAELIFGVTHEGAHDVADLLERRTRVALVPDDAVRARPHAERALAWGGHP